LVHLKQEEGWKPDRAAIVIQINPFFAQQEHNSITSLSDNTSATMQAQQTVDKIDLTGGIISYLV